MDETQPASASGGKNFARTPTSWDAQDDILLMHLKDTQKLGWKEIASHFTNRTPNACQFRWRRLKSGNLKNPPKSAASASPAVKLAAMGVAHSSHTSHTNNHHSLSEGNTPRRKSELATPGATQLSVYSPLANATFTGYDTVNTALAGLLALSGPGAGNTPVPVINTTSHPQTFDNLPKLDVPLDPQTHSAAAAGTSGGYFTDISVDPTLNLPHNRPNPHHSGGSGNSGSGGGGGASGRRPSLLGGTPRNSAAGGMGPLPSLHNNLIIQISRDDRTLVSLQLRLSVLSLPLKLMHIPHHHQQQNQLAHMPALFGGSSVSGPAGGSILGPSGLPHLALTLLSIRNGSIVGRNGSDAGAKREKPEKNDGDTAKSEKPDRVEVAKKLHDGSGEKAGANVRERRSGATVPAAGSAPIFRIPWSMEEDELLINRRRKELSFAELLILLPQRTEGEIWARIDALERLRNGHRDLKSKLRRQSLVGFDDVEDFYLEVDSFGAIDSDDDDADDDDDVAGLHDDVLVDVDGNLAKRARKRRASLAVNPLSVREGIRRRL